MGWQCEETYFYLASPRQPSSSNSFQQTPVSWENSKFKSIWWKTELQMPYQEFSWTILIHGAVNGEQLSWGSDQYSGHWILNKYILYYDQRIFKYLFGKFSTFYMRECHIKWVNTAQDTGYFSQKKKKNLSFKLLGKLVESPWTVR